MPEALLRRMRRWAVRAAMPAAVVALSVALVSGWFNAFVEPAYRHLAAWSALVLVGAVALARQVRRKLRGLRAPWHWALEASALLAVGALAIAQLGGEPFHPLVYLAGAGFALALPLNLALPALGWLLGLDAGLLLPRHEYTLLAAHAGFTAIFAALYHGVLGARLRAASAAESEAVGRRIAEAEASARDLRLIATASGDAERHLLAGVSEMETAIRGALAVADAALQPYTAAVFLLAADGASVRLRDSISRGESLFRGPLNPREGALGAVLASGKPVRLQADGPALSHYEGPSPVTSFCGVPIAEVSGTTLGALVADRDGAFSAEDEKVLAELAAQIARAVEAERLLSTVRKEKEEKARFFRALGELNKSKTVAEAAETTVAQALDMCPALDLCAVTIVVDSARAGGRPRHRIQAVRGDSSGALAGLTFADNAGLVSNVVRLAAPLPERSFTAMDKTVIFDGGTQVRGLAALKIFPLRSGDATFGTLVCGSRHRDALPEKSQIELSLLAMQAAESVARTRLYEHVEKLATTDGLTGLLNRRTFNAQLATRLREAQRYRRHLSLLLVDIDHFKKVNDTHGHLAGDAVLRGVAAIAASQARETDIVARYGGEELALVLPETDSAGARAIAERLRAAAAAADHPTEKGHVRVTISLGIATWPGDGAAAEELIEAADKALYRAKQAGRNRVESARGKAAA
jgi:two-component system, cell cycle response regulator